MKKCALCKQEISITFFKKSKTGKNGLNARCNDCVYLINKNLIKYGTAVKIKKFDTDGVLLKVCTKCKQEKPLHFFGNQKTNTSTGKLPQCKTCTSQYKKDNRETRLQKNREYNLKNKDKVKKYRRLSLLRRLYKLTEQDYDNMLLSQNNRCKICNTIPEKIFHVDHCHTTGKVRGLLCEFCNRGLGQFRDNVNIMNKAIDYINIHKIERSS